MRPSRVSIEDPATSHEDPLAHSPSFFADRELVRVDEATLAELKRLSARTGESARLCLHRSPEEALHDSVIVLRRDRLSPAHRHGTKAETFQVLEGEALVVAFDAEGEVVDACRLSGGRPGVYRVGAGVYHANIPLTEVVVVRESTLGPYVRERDLAFAPWAPDQADREALLAWRDRLLTAHLIPRPSADSFAQPSDPPGGPSCR